MRKKVPIALDGTVCARASQLCNINGMKVEGTKKIFCKGEGSKTMRRTKEEEIEKGGRRSWRDAEKTLNERAARMGWIWLRGYHRWLSFGRGATIAGSNPAVTVRLFLSLKNKIKKIKTCLSELLDLATSLSDERATLTGGKQQSEWHGRVGANRTGAVGVLSKAREELHKG